MIGPNINVFRGNIHSIELTVSLKQQRKYIQCKVIHQNIGDSPMESGVSLSQFLFYRGNSAVNIRFEIE